MRHAGKITAEGRHTTLDASELVSEREGRPCGCATASETFQGWRPEMLGSSQRPWQASAAFNALVQRKLATSVDKGSTSR